MNKIKIVAFAVLASVFSGNVYALMSIKRRNQIILACGVVTGAAVGAGYYYNKNKSPQEPKVSRLSKFFHRKKQSTKKTDFRSTLSDSMSMERWFPGMYYALGWELSVLAGIYAIDRFTVIGLISKVDGEIKKSESVVLNPKCYLQNVGYFSKVAGSLKKCHGEIIDYLENSPVEQTIEDGYLSKVMERKERLEELLAKIAELENGQSEAIAAEKTV